MLTLRAACALLDDADALAPANPADALAAMAADLDFRCRRITRPLASMAAP